MKQRLRVAFFPDSFDEPNGVATLSREFVAFADSHQLPFFYVRAGKQRRATTCRCLTSLELNRTFASVPVDKEMYFDPLFSRHRNWAVQQVRRFRPDVIHITGPGDMGLLGFWVSHILGVPLAASWHTNLHEYAARRLEKALVFLPRSIRRNIAALGQRLTLDGLLRFYRLPHFVLAPNQEMVDLLALRTTRPSYLMAHGVNTARFSPGFRQRTNGPFTIGYVGRLTAEKNLRSFAELERRLVAAGHQDLRLLLVGDGSEREWLRTHLQFADLPGALRGDQLGTAYANMDVFVFPSHTDTLGLVILEAMASGVPVCVHQETATRVRVQNGVTGFVADDFTPGVLALMQNEDLRHKMGLEALNCARMRNWDAVFGELYQTYEAALQREDVRRRIRTPNRCGW